jgi:hypothetical protein
MKLDAYLQAHEFVQIERPPLPWDAETEEAALEAPARDAGGRFAYARNLGSEGSVTVYLRRAPAT